MTKILVKNGDWDTARAELGTVLDKNKASFNAQFEAVFAPNRKPGAAEAPAAKAAPVPASGRLVLPRSQRG
jgi:hypothetical protein